VKVGSRYLVFEREEWLLRVRVGASGVSGKLSSLSDLELGIERQCSSALSFEGLRP
jgi:hypothetical protein